MQDKSYDVTLSRWRRRGPTDLRTIRMTVVAHHKGKGLRLADKSPVEMNNLYPGDPQMRLDRFGDKSLTRDTTPPVAVAMPTRHSQPQDIFR